MYGASARTLTNIIQAAITCHLKQPRFERLAGTQGFGQRTPEWIKPRVRHFEYSADIGWFAPVEKLGAGRRVGVQAIATFELSERDQRIEEVSDAARMKLQPSRQHVCAERPVGQQSEQPEFDCA